MLIMRSLGLVVLAFGAAACARAQVYQANWGYASPTVTVVSATPSVSVVVVNPTPSAPVAALLPEPSPANYLIAFKGGSVRLAEQYWVDGTTLYYITPDRERRTAPLESVDRALSKQLNSEQNVAFRLPSEERKGEAAREVIHHVSAGANRRKTCTCR
jgi:hypothetical protein